jgi:excisionase family DNA binding protein
MRNSPVNVVDPTELADDERDRLQSVADAVSESGTVDLESLPAAVREQLRFALEAYARGETVAAVATGKPLSTTEAAKLLGMSRTHLTRLCEDGHVDSFMIGTARRVPAEEVFRILSARGAAKTAAREAAATADERRRTRAARRAELL